MHEVDGAFGIHERAGLGVPAENPAGLTHDRSGTARIQSRCNARGEPRASYTDRAIEHRRLALGGIAVARQEIGFRHVRIDADGAGKMAHGILGRRAHIEHDRVACGKARRNLAGWNVGDPGPAMLHVVDGRLQRLRAGRYRRQPHGGTHGTQRDGGKNEECGYAGKIRHRSMSFSDQS
jgi:hypothetical protein